MPSNDYAIVFTGTAAEAIEYLRAAWAQYDADHGADTLDNVEDENLREEDSA